MAWFVEMKRVTEKNNCTGCGACVNVCAGGYIFMRQDISGFLYPVIDTGKCTGCGKCRQICPQNVLKKAGISESVNTEAGIPEDRNIYLGVHTLDKGVRMESSSGGAFSAFAEEILARGGAVCAASLCEDMVVRHIIAEKSEDLFKLRKTKYVQSETGMVFRDIRGILKEIENGSGKPREVLFVGTPCQCMGLRGFLGKEYSNLYTAALVCYGVPSPKVFSNYIKFLGKKKGGMVTSFFFRDKRNHDNGHTVSYSVCEKGGANIGDTSSKTVEYSHSLYEDAYSKLYFRNHIIRPSCFGCSYAGPDRETDITLGDFWGIEKVNREFDDGDGTSLVILHSENGKKLWERVKSKTNYFECQREDVLQPRLRGPVAPPRSYPAMGLLVREVVFKKLQK